MAVADARGGKTCYCGEITNTPDEVRELVKKLCADGGLLSFFYEVGPCGYEIYRQLSQLSHHCSVVAPPLITWKPGDRVKTDRRDSEKLYRLDRAGELTPVWVSGQETASSGSA